jgi:gas vesicle protein
MTNKDVCLGFLVGAVTGAAVALLYAPQSGDDTREKIRTTGREAGEMAKNHIAEARSGVERAVSDVTAKANKVATAVDRGREAFQSTLASQA